MTDTATIDLCYGSQSFKNSSSKCNVFALATQKGPRNKQRAFPSEVLEPAPNTRRHHRTGKIVPDTIPAAQDGSDANGIWYKIVLEAKEGTILLLQTSSTMNVRPYYGAALLVALRNDGPLIQVSAKLIQEPLATFNAITIFTGRGDLINPREAQQMGATLRMQYINNYFQADEQKAVFVCQTLNEGTPKPRLTTVTTADGSVKDRKSTV